MIKQGNAGYPVTEAILHCAAINTGQFDGYTPFAVVSEINRWHLKRLPPFPFGYHGLIMPDGEFFAGRPYTKIGAHCIGKNRGTLGFLLIESRKIKEIGTFADYYTPEQDFTLRMLLASIPGLKKVSGHNDYANKLCPGFQVISSDWL